MNLENKKVAVLGLGISGLATVRSLLKLSAKPILLNDGDVNSWLPIEFQTLPAFDSNTFLNKMQSCDLLIKSPGVPNDHAIVLQAIDLGIQVITEIELAFAFAKAPIIALTGTNGKTTTTMMIDQLLINSGVKVFTGGNIGRPFCEIITDETDYEVYNLELSSFQLEHIQNFKADFAAILNISMSHQERYKSFDDYQLAKLNIFKNNDNKSFSIAPKSLKAQRSGKSLDFSDEDIQRFCREYDFKNFKLKGDFHLANLYVAANLAQAYLGKSADIQKLIDTFVGAPFRLQFVGNFEGLKLYNDSKSTNWQATLAALKQFDESPYLIIGGKLRDQIELSKEIKDVLLQNSKQIFLIGESENFLAKELGAHAVSLGSLEKVQDFIMKNNLKGDLLFSPAFPSFDQFNNYVQRGEFFNKLFNCA